MRIYCDGTAVVTRVARVWPNHHVVVVHVEASSVHSFNNLLDLLHPLPTRRKLHRVDEERAFVPYVGHGPGRFCEQEFVHSLLMAAIPNGQAPWATSGVLDYA